MKRAGLDELMIVNPGSPAAIEAVRLGADGRLRRVPGVPPARGPFFLDADGIVYQAEGARADGRGRYFLGADGTLYETDR